MPDERFVSYSVALISQGRHKFYSLTMPSDVLAESCFVTNRYEDPIEGFQRILDKKRAQQIADYIDNGLGTIPTAIVLSAQKQAEFQVTGGSKTVKFKITPKSFLVLDGQHRVYGFHLAKTDVRIPVIIYNGLSRRDESRIFIDINTKQKPVPNELLLDIKNLAEYENDLERFYREIFNLFHESSDSALYGLTTPATKSTNKISRVTFNSSMQLISRIFINKRPEESYFILNSYLKAFLIGLSRKGIENSMTSTVVFKAIMAHFPVVARRVKDKIGTYSVEGFYDVLSPMFSNMNSNKVTSPGRSYKALTDLFNKWSQLEFEL